MESLLPKVLSWLWLMLALGGQAGAKAMDVPERAGAWHRTGPMRLVDRSNIFDYMNGGGELYLAYRFDHLEVFEYAAAGQEDIMVEVYHMHSSADAFGLLSLDWTGEPVELGFSPTPVRADAQKKTRAPPVRALYGSGLLRIATDNLYVRVMAHRETAASRKAVLSLGEHVVRGRAPSQQPELVERLPQAPGPAWRLRQDRIGYFRSHLVLNSLFYLSHENILALDLECEGVTASYEYRLNSGSLDRIQYVVLRYPGARQAEKALKRFREAYLPEHRSPGQSLGDGAVHTFQTEKSFLGLRADGHWLTLAFQCPSQAAAVQILSARSEEAAHKEAEHER